MGAAPCQRLDASAEGDAAVDVQNDARGVGRVRAQQEQEWAGDLLRLRKPAHGEHVRRVAPAFDHRGVDGAGRDCVNLDPPMRVVG